MYMRGFGGYSRAEAQDTGIEVVVSKVSHGKLPVAANLHGKFIADRDKIPRFDRRLTAMILPRLAGAVPSAHNPTFYETAKLLGDFSGSCGVRRYDSIRRR